MENKSNVLINNGVEANVAVYKEQIIKEYKDNPFIEALPNILSNEEAIDKLAVYPYFSEDERKYEAHYRYHLVQRLFQYFQPLNVNIDLESRVSRIIRQGYIARNSFKPEYSEAFQSGYKLILSGDIELSCNQSFRTTASGFSLIGVSGIGKSTALNRVLSLTPQLLVHSEYKECKFSTYQITWIKLDCSFDGSTKGLCIDFFSRVDSIIKTTYHKKYGTGKHSVNVLMPIMAQVAKSINLGALIIDEIQHLSLAKSGGAEKMLNFFTTLINTMGIPIITIGTPKALSILQGQFRQARRGCGQGDMILEPMKNDDNWDLIMEGMWDYQWTKKPVPYTKEFKDVIFEECQGITDIAVKIFAMSQIRAISSGKEEITPKLIHNVAKDNFRLIRPMIEALRSGNLNSLSKFEDLLPINIDNFINQEREKIVLNSKIKELQNEKKQKEKSNKDYVKEQAIIKLVDLDVEQSKAKRLVEEVINKIGVNAEIKEIVKEAYKTSLKLDIDKKTKRNITKKEQLENHRDMRVIVKEGKHKNMTAYEALYGKGYIKRVEEDFFRAG